MYAGSMRLGSAGGAVARMMRFGTEMRAMAAAMWAAMMRARRCRRDQLELMRAPDEMLDDLGISRGEIVGLVWLGSSDVTRRRR